MIRYKSDKQLSIEEFRTPFEIKLDKENRWVILSKAIPWDSLASIYYSTMSSDQGAPTIDARIVIGAMIIKHKMKLDDREVIEYIRENVYVQYFLGLSDYTYEEVFDRSLFTTLRYRLGAEKFDKMSQVIISKAISIEENKRSKTDNKTTPGKSVEKQTQEETITTPSTTEDKAQETKNKGKLMMDATVADQMILYPTDLGLLSKSREESERLIDILCIHYEVKTKPRTYRRKARKEYLLTAKKKQKTYKEIRKAIGKQLNYLKRNLKSIDKLLDMSSNGEIPFNHRDLRIYWVIQHIYEQQRYMYENKMHSYEHRIVNIYQPYVRPIVRGKEKIDVEFGAKLGVSMNDGFARINNISWEAYNESGDLKKQVEDFHRLQGHYPEVVITDKIYGTRDNRNWLKEHGIRYSGKALGRPQKESLTAYEKRKNRKELSIRNQIEGKFGQGKNGYNLNKIRARAAQTSESWIACIFFVMNLLKFIQIMAKGGGVFLFSLFAELVFQIKMIFFNPKLKIAEIYL